MFAGLINNARAAVSQLVLKYVARASVAVPFVIAFGFAIAAIAVMLVERFGHVAAYWFMAGGLAVIGLIAAVIVSMREHEEEKQELRAEAVNNNDALSEAAIHTAMQALPAFAGALFSAPGAATTSLRVVRLLGRNYALVVLLLLIGVLFWRPRDVPKAATKSDLKPNGLHPADTLH